MQKIHLIAAARPNFMKIAPLYHALKKAEGIAPSIVHTGQHYDVKMSDAFFKDLMLPEPHLHLGIGSGTHAEQTGRVMIAYEKVLMEDPPDLVVVVGDVNSTVAATLAAVKLGIKVAHLEAGLRSFDRTMPEEINRIVTDALADILWTPSSDGDENLLSEGVAREKIECVGNIMIDSLEMMRPAIEKENAVARMGVTGKSYGIVTLHRPSNVDDPGALKIITEALIHLSNKIPLLFPVHPRTRKNLVDQKLMERMEAAENISLLNPLGYVEFMNLVFSSHLVVTDSGGIQEETTYLGIPCLTLRPNTERPITITHGTNRLCKPEDLQLMANDALSSSRAESKKPPLWDGRTAERVVVAIKKLLN